MSVELNKFNNSFSFRSYQLDILILENQVEGYFSMQHHELHLSIDRV